MSSRPPDQQQRANQAVSAGNRIDLAGLRRMKAAGRKFAMLTAYDYPTAILAQAAGVHSLLIGDSMGTVLLGHESTRNVPLALMLVLGEAVRRGAPDVYLIGDMPYEAMVVNDNVALDAARRFCDEAGCDGVKFEAASDQVGLVERLVSAGIETTVHLGLRPQSVTNREGYRAQARDAASLADLVADARRMTAAGAAMLLLEAVPSEAAQAVVAAVDVPVVGCGAGPACDGHVLVTQDMLGMSGIRPPRFVPVLAEVGKLCGAAMRRYVEAVSSGAYPAPEHTYPMRKQPASPSTTP
ncbi:MAG: 3-methyl-2-oxobutanoate hydroxymethyltransferase [Planctomycetes bacterium]|nr:3-methyl-2-oxobutanoate hydroxymethyltransferase [Planctomycetota bacterium]